MCGERSGGSRRSSGSGCCCSSPCCWRRWSPLGVRVPGGALARAIASRILCATALADSCGDEPALIAAYGDRSRRAGPRAHADARLRGRLARGSRSTGAAAAAPPAATVAGRATCGAPTPTCRSPPSSTSSTAGRGSETEGADCSGGAPATSTSSIGSTTPIPRPSAASRSPARRATTTTTGSRSRSGSARTATSTSAPPPTTATTTATSDANWASDAGIGPLRDLNETLGARAENGWGPETHLLLVSGGSHAGNLGDERGGRYTPAAAVHLSRSSRSPPTDSTAFAISPPWLKQVWRDPEAEETD